MDALPLARRVYLILTGGLPSAAIGRLMDGILVSSIDHGATPPSALSARTVASTGASLGGGGRGRDHVDQSSSRRGD